MNEDINRITWHVLKGPRVFFAILIVTVVLWALAQPGDLILLLLLVYFSGLIFCVYLLPGAFKELRDEALLVFQKWMRNRNRRVR